jgi:branched-chain amino acid transport system substrate-binding protein
MTKMSNRDDGDFWYNGKVTRRRLVGWGGGILGASMLVPAPWRAVFAGEKPFKVGSLQPLTGPAAPGGKTAVVGLQMAVDRINQAGGIHGRPVELILADDQSKPDVGRRQAQKLVDEDLIDVSCGGFLSNVCLACMPVWRENKIVNMISVCLDTTITGSNCNRYTFRPFDAAPAQALAFGPQLVKLGKKWHIAFADYSWGQSTRDAYADAIKKAGGEVVGTTGIPIGTADMTPFLSKISGDFDGLFGIFFGGDGVTLGTQAYDLGLSKKYKFAGDGAIAVPSSLPALGRKIDGFYGIDRYVPVFQGQLDTPHHRRFYDEAVKRLTTVAPQAPVPDRYVQSNYEAMNCLKVGMEKSDFRGREDTDKLIAALEGLEMRAGDDFPQGDKFLRKEDHQAFVTEFIYRIEDGKYHLLDSVPAEQTVYPSTCKMPA